MEDNAKKNVYLTLHRKFVHEDIPYTDRKTGEEKTFHSVTLPKGTVIDGVDVSYYQFSPMFVNPSRFKGENFRDMPLLADREVWLKKGLMNSRRPWTRAAPSSWLPSTTRPRTPARRQTTRPARRAMPSPSHARGAAWTTLSRRRPDQR